MALTLNNAVIGQLPFSFLRGPAPRSSQIPLYAFLVSLATSRVFI